MQVNRFILSGILASIVSICFAQGEKSMQEITKDATEIKGDSRFCIVWFVLFIESVVLVDSRILSFLQVWARDCFV